MKIVYTDISDSSPEMAIRVFERNKTIISEFDKNSVYSLVNAKDVRFNSKLIQVVKETVKENNPYVRATAVSGLNTLTRLMVNSIVSFTGREIKLFENEDEAKEWLYQRFLDVQPAFTP
ncbi:STAS/SEC14 domain-containing protein [Fulvivirgaceae bacterium BMA10]|uniref:STAS/SEC14 domain-containing protein n=1 Tax=Splendidivirga corallicola TaxID=3051826 RepID=A0ABT8KM88_9BACT|nr:STAS/SEC14 domain-containing protein [Fulvivirgaceae bacterium BMA10]